MSDDADLQDLLIGWTGGTLDPERCTALLERLRQDPALRRRFAAEVRLLAKLKAVQSQAPRWLRLEDTLGAAAPPTGDLANRVLRHPRLRRQRTPPWWIAWTSAAAAVLVVAWWLAQPASLTNTPPPSSPGEILIVAAAQPRGEDASISFVPGTVLVEGQLRLASGQVTVALASGVLLDVAGPATCEFISPMLVHLERGRMRTRVPPAAHGFVVRAPGFDVIDRGTEIGINLDVEHAQVRVFSGAGEVVVGGAAGAEVSEELAAGQAVQIEHATRRIMPSTVAADRFVPALALDRPALRLDSKHRERVLAARPIGYWRFEQSADGQMVNEVNTGPALTIHGQVAAVTSGTDNRVLSLLSEQRDRWLDCRLPASFDPRGDFAIETWCLLDSYQSAALLALRVASADGPEGHVVLLEAAGASNTADQRAGVGFRFLHRWPPGPTGGNSLRSRLAPLTWQHVVAQRRAGRSELWINGTRSSSSALRSVEADTTDGTLACRLIIGQLKGATGGDQRSFGGQLDELAIYSHALSAATIAAHAAARQP